MTNEMQGRAAAVHEAGHAMAADDLGIAFDGVSILSQGEAAGRVLVEHDDCCPMNAEFEAWADHQAIIDYAGHAAVVVILGVCKMNVRDARGMGAGSDFTKAATRLQHDRRRIAKAKAKSLEIVTRRRDDIEKIADALLNRGSLSQGQISWLLQYGLPVPCEA